MAIYTSEPVIGGKRLRCRHCLHNERCDDQLIGGDKAALIEVWPSFVADLARCCGDGGAGRGPPRRRRVARPADRGPLRGCKGLRRCWAGRRPGVAGTAGPSPAAGLAGVDPRHGVQRPARGRRPRARGGGPCRRNPSRLSNVVPALAGVGPSAASNPRRSRRRPRARGGGPTLRGPSSSEPGFVPVILAELTTAGGSRSEEIANRWIRIGHPLLDLVAGSTTTQPRTSPRSCRLGPSRRDRAGGHSPTLPTCPSHRTCCAEIGNHGPPEPPASAPGARRGRGPEQSKLIRSVSGSASSPSRSKGARADAVARQSGAAAAKQASDTVSGTST